MSDFFSGFSSDAQAPSPKMMGLSSSMITQLMSGVMPKHIPRVARPWVLKQNIKNDSK